MKHVLIIGSRHDGATSAQLYESLEEAEAAFFKLPVYADSKYDSDQENSFILPITEL